MATKAFKGEVIESKDATFSNNDGVAIVGWRIVLMITDEIQKQFFIAETNPEWEHAKQLVRGNHALIHAEARAGNGDRVKYVPVEIKRIGEDSQEIPF